MGPVRGRWVDINSSKMNLKLLVCLPFLLTGWSTCTPERMVRSDRAGRFRWPTAYGLREHPTSDVSPPPVPGLIQEEEGGRLSSSGWPFGRCLEMILTVNYVLGWRGTHRCQHLNLGSDDQWNEISFRLTKPIRRDLPRPNTIIQTDPVPRIVRES